MVAQRQAVALLVMLLGAYSASAYPMIWTAMTKDCSAVPQASYGPHSAPVEDAKTLMTIKKNGAVVAKICPGVVHKIKAVFPEQRQYILTTSHGAMTGGVAECPNRSFSQVAKPDVEVDLTIPCDASGDVTLSLLSVSARSGDRTYQSITTSLPVKDLKTCPASPCHSQAAQKPASSGDAAAAAPAAGAAAPGTLLMESAAAPAGMEMPKFDPAQMAEIEKQIMALDPKLVKDGTVNVQDLLTRLGLQQQAQQALQGQPGVAAPAPENAGAPAAEAPKVFQIGDIFGPLKHLLPGQQQEHKEGQQQGVNPLKFLQSVANLMPNQQGGEAAGGEGGQNPLKMLQNVASLVAAGSKDGKDSGAPIMNLLQTVGNAIQNNGNDTAQKDGLPILNMLQQLGGMVGQGGKDKDGNPTKGLDPAAMLDVVKALGGLMPSGGEGGSGGAPNMHNLMNFVNAVGKVIPGVGPQSSEPLPKDLPSAGIAVLKSMSALLPKEAAAGAPQGPNWPAMLQFVKASGNLIQLMRPPAGAAGVAPPKDE